MKRFADLHAQLGDQLAKWGTVRQAMAHGPAASGRALGGAR